MHLNPLSLEDFIKTKNSTQIGDRLRRLLGIGLPFAVVSLTVYMAGFSFRSLFSGSDHHQHQHQYHGTSSHHAPTNLDVATTGQGCNGPSPWRFDTYGHFRAHYQGRSFLVHLPSDYDQSVEHPVVLSYHGYKGESSRQEVLTGLSANGLTIGGRGIIAVYPDGEYGSGKNGHSPERAWQGAPYAKAGINDIAFTHAILDSLEANLCVDKQRIYVTGKSNGGGFANLLACTPSSAARIAAFAPVSAALYPGAKPLGECQPGRPVPLISFHGTADATIPYVGREANKKGNTDYALPHIQRYLEEWAIRNGCDSRTPSRAGHLHGSTQASYWYCDVEGYAVGGLGHSWPTRAGLDHGGMADFDATSEHIIPFFNKYTLP